MLARLDRLIAERGGLSRKEAREAVCAGRVGVGGIVMRNASERVDDTLIITVDGLPLETERYLYVMLNKPAGYVSATRDNKLPTVMDLIPEGFSRRGVAPAGRLDRDAEGFLLLTNDGELAHRVTSPKYEVWKEYHARVEGKPDETAVKRFVGGVVIDGGITCLPAFLTIGETQNSLCDCVARVCEGRFHQVKRMFEAIGHPVVFLKRLSIGGLPLDNGLQTGQYRLLSPNELDLLKKATRLKS